MFILIADDEKMIRLSLQSMLEELYPNEHMYIHASNGQAAIAQVQKASSGYRISGYPHAAHERAGGPGNLP